MSVRTIWACDFSPDPCKSSNRFTIRSGCRHSATDGRQFCQRSRCLPRSRVVPSKPITTEEWLSIEFDIRTYLIVYSGSAEQLTISFEINHVRFGTESAYIHNESEDKEMANKTLFAS